MAQLERAVAPESQSVSQENRSVWSSRLFRAGLLLTAVGLLYKGLTGKWNVAVAGVIWTGAAWAWWKGKK